MEHNEEPSIQPSLRLIVRIAARPEREDLVSRMGDRYGCYEGDRFDGGKIPRRMTIDDIH